MEVFRSFSLRSRKHGSSAITEKVPLLSAEYTVHLSRNERGLGMTFDSMFHITRLLPACAARECGEISVGDRLLSVDGQELVPGDSVATFFPLGDRTFELLLLRAEPTREETREATDKSRRRRAKPEQTGKYDPARATPVFEEVQWNEYCVLLPNGTSRPFNEDVRSSALTGYLRKKKVVRDGKVDFVLTHGEGARK